MNTIRTTFATLTFILLSLISYSQSGNITPFWGDDAVKSGQSRTYNYNELVKLKGRTLLVVVDDTRSPEFSKIMREGFTKYWNLTKVNFITPSEVKNYIESDQYALFCFTLIDSYYGETGGARGNGMVRTRDDDKIIDADSLPPNTNNKHSHTKDNSSDKYFFQFMLCGHFPALSKHNLENVLVCNYQEVFLGKQEFYKTDSVFNHPVKYYQAIAIPYIIPDIIRFQKDMEPCITGNSAPDDDRYKNITTRVVKFTITMGSKTYKHELPVDFIIKPGTQDKMKGKKIYMDSSLCNDRIIDVLSRTLNVDKSVILSVDRSTINEVFKNQDPNILILDYNHINVGAVEVGFNLGIYTTSGDVLGYTGSPTFWHRKYNPDYSLNYVSESSK